MTKPKALTAAQRKVAAAKRKAAADKKAKTTNKREWARVIKAAESVLRSAGVLGKVRPR